MPKQKTIDTGPTLDREWPLPPAATLGSSVRARGILLEVRARLPFAQRKRIDNTFGALVLRVPEDDPDTFHAISLVVEDVLKTVETMPVIPREIQDILSISPSERHRWLKDGRLQSAGTRTVKLRGRAREITFHVFDPRLVEDLLDRDAVTAWREDDIVTAAENRRRAAWNRRLHKAQQTNPSPQTAGLEDGPAPERVGWAEFAREGLLR